MLQNFTSWTFKLPQDAPVHDAVSVSQSASDLGGQVVQEYTPDVKTGQVTLMTRLQANKTNKQVHKCFFYILDIQR